MHSIGFVGVGIMGRAMVGNLLKKGFEVHIYARHPEKVKATVEAGAVLHPTLKEAVAGRDAVISMVGGPADVKEIYEGEDGILASAKNGAYLIDMTTSSPALAVKLHEEGQKLGLHVLDCPVTGGDRGAQAGTLSLLCGGLKEDFEAVMPIFKALGTVINLEGGPGAGQHCKAVNQIMVAGAVAGLCEGFAYAKAHGLDLPTVLRSVKDGAAGSKSIDLYADRILKGDNNPGGYVKFLVKDLSIAQDGAAEAGLSLEMLNSVLAAYRQMMEEGMGDLGIHALGELYFKHQQKSTP